MTEPAERVYQQLHKDCGGVLSVCASKTAIRIVCTLCRTAWDVHNDFTGYDVAIPAEWESYIPQGGGQ